MALDRTWYNTLVDDTGDNLSGTLWNKAAVDSLMDATDAALAVIDAAVAAITTVVDKDVTVQDVVNTTTETTVYSFTVPGGTLSTNRALRLTLIGDYLNNTGSSQDFQFKLKYGGTLYGYMLLNAGNQVPTDGGDFRHSLQCEWILSAANATNAQASVATIALGAIGTATGGGGVPFRSYESGRTNGTIDSTADQALIVTFQHGAANANLSARAHAVWLEKL